MKNFTDFSELRQCLESGDLTVVYLVQYYLKNIEAQKGLNAFIEVFDDVLEKASLVDKKIKAGTAGKLAGMVLGVKDVYCVTGKRVSAGSKILDGFVSTYTATSIQRLLDEDALIIGRQNCDEFAMGSSNEHSAYGPVRNAANPERVPGGSSGGSAVAVQADMCFASIGSDTGGSVRQPGAFCGVVGLKPSYSRISRYGLIAYASSFDCVGPITRSVNDAALLLETMAGKDEMDSTSSSMPVAKYSRSNSDFGKFRVACFGSNLPFLQEEVAKSFAGTIQNLKQLGHDVEAIELPMMEYLLPTYYILTTAEASSNLSRFDGVRYGYRHSNPENLEQMYKLTRSQGFGKEVKKRILLGTFTLSADYFDAYFTKAQKVRRLIQESSAQIFSQYDVLLMPTTPSVAFPIGARTKDPMEMYYADVFTVWANLAGVPAVNIPAGFDKSGLPIGIQAHSAWFQEEVLLNFARLLESKQIRNSD